MRKSMRLTLTVLALASVAAVASAHTASPSVNRRQHRQMHRIHQGVRSGELTCGEAHRLRLQERAIRKEERMMKRDGVLTPRERIELQRDLNRSSRRIYRFKHD